jgi:hypothetical protein
MEPIISIPYSEFKAIEILQTKFKKNKDYAFYIPVSRQQKGVDFILVKNGLKSETTRFQVKSSKLYSNGNKHILWLNNFIEKTSRENADWYLIFGLYPLITKNSTKKSKSIENWKAVTLCFTPEEVRELLTEEKFLYVQISFNEKMQITSINGTRGFKNNGVDLTAYQLEKRLDKIMK